MVSHTNPRIPAPSPPKKKIVTEKFKFFRKDKDDDVRRLLWKKIHIQNPVGKEERG
jgi:hypothetical protein